MPTADNSSPAVVTAKWKTTIECKEEQFGTITLDDDFQLRFPLLDSPGSIPAGTNLLWGISDHLKRCTALTLAFASPDITVVSIPGRPDERIYRAHSYVRYLLVGREYITNPSTEFVAGVVLTPQPTGDLHLSTFNSSRPLDVTLFEIDIPCVAATVQAWVGPIGLEFSLRFHDPRTLETALEEANILCLFLSFLSHQYVHATGLAVWVAGGDILGPHELYQVHYRAFPQHVLKRGYTWVRDTLILPDEQSARFSEALQKWYSSNTQYLRSRYLYRYSLQDCYTFSSGRFVAIFQALEGVMDKSGYKLITTEELDKAKSAIRMVLAGADQLDTFIRKINNSQPPHYVWKQELPKIFASANVAPLFNVEEFVDRIFLRRNKSSHGGGHLNEAFLEESLVNDTMLLTAIYAIVESIHVGLDARETVKNLCSSFNLDLPLMTDH